MNIFPANTLDAEWQPWFSSQSSDPSFYKPVDCLALTFSSEYQMSNPDSEQSCSYIVAFKPKKVNDISLPQRLHLIRYS